MKNLTKIEAEEIIKDSAESLADAVSMGDARLTVACLETIIAAARCGLWSKEDADELIASFVKSAYDAVDTLRRE